MYAPNNYEEYLRELERLNLNLISSRYDLEYAIVVDGWTQNTSILFDVVVTNKRHFESFRNAFSKRFPDSNDTHFNYLKKN